MSINKFLFVLSHPPVIVIPPLKGSATREYHYVGLAKDIEYSCVSRKTSTITKMLMYLKGLYFILFAGGN